MNVTAELMLDSQLARDVHDLLHRVVGIPDNSGTEEQPLDVIAPVKIERELNNFISRETRARHIARDAVKAIVDAVVREQNLEQRNAAPVRRVAMTDPRTGRGTESAGARVTLRRPAARARRIVLGSVREDCQFRRELHLSNYDPQLG